MRRDVGREVCEDVEEAREPRLSLCDTLTGNSTNPEKRESHSEVTASACFPPLQHSFKIPFFRFFPHLTH